MDRREQELNAPVASTQDSKADTADKVRHALRHTVVTKRLVNLFIENMSEHEHEEKHEQ